MTIVSKHNVFLYVDGRGSRSLLRGVQWAVILVIASLPRVCFANDSPPACALEPRKTRPPVAHYSGAVELEGDDRFLLRGWDISQVVIYAQYDSSGTLRCASPLDGPSYYWPYAFTALSKAAGALKTDAQGRVVVVFPDPDKEIMKEFHDQLVPRCGANEPLDSLLHKGRTLLLKRSVPPAEAEKCFSLALALASDSVAANEGMAVAYLREKRTDAAIARIRR